VEEEKKDRGNVITITINKWVLIVMSIVVALGVGGGAGYFLLGREAGPRASVASSPTPTGVAIPRPTQSSVGVPPAYLIRPVSAEQMFSEFTCPCCGQPIGDCGCGMAKERKEFVTGQVAAGKNKLEIYLAYADQYGLDTFASQEVKRDIREYKLAHAPEERPQIVLEPQKINLGDVSTKEGKISTSITIKNTGQEDLIVDSLSTSCGCTTVSVVNKGQEGPIFGMGTPPEAEDWSTTIRPGEIAELRIYYDPGFHGEARGPMVREIYVSSNDPVDPVVKARIELNQVD
jgi:archaellum component FlaG (FlaF/FlaG flagellin family)